MLINHDNSLVNEHIDHMINEHYPQRACSLKIESSTKLKFNKKECYVSLSWPTPRDPTNE